MKTFLGLLLLSGVLAVQAYRRHPPEAKLCRLPLSDVSRGAKMVCPELMDYTALEVLIDFMSRRHVSTSAIVCASQERINGILYRVQYDRNRWVKIQLSSDGETARVVRHGYIREPETQQSTED